MSFSEFHTPHRGGAPAIDPAIIDKLIRSIEQEGSEEAFLKFYEIRKVWCQGYPLIHARSTYGFLDGIYLPINMKLSLIPVVADLAVNEQIEYFHCALFTLKTLLPSDQILPRPSGFGSQLLTLRERVKKYSFLPNLTDTWNSLATTARCLKPTEPDESYAISANQMGVYSDKYLEFFPCPLPKADSAESACPLSPEEILESTATKAVSGETVDLLHSSHIRSSNWWVFGYPFNTSYSKRYVKIFIRESADGALETSKKITDSYKVSEEWLHKEILRREFSVRASY